LSVDDRRQLIKRNHESVSVRRQCELLGLNRSSFYFEPKGESEETFELMKRIDIIYTACVFYGSRRIREALLRQFDVRVSRDRVRRLMRLMGIMGKLPGPQTTRRHPGHAIYPNLLRNLAVERPNQVWCTDITYLPMARGTMYLVAIMDWHSRCVLSWRLSNSLDTGFCLEALEEAIERHGQPEIFHSDQGCQFTSEAFTGLLKAHGITISMSGRGRAYDNIFVERFWRSLKYERIHKEEYATVAALREAVAAYIHFYNTDRPHQALDYQVPWEVHATGLAKAPPRGQVLHTGGRAQSADPAPPTSRSPILGAGGLRAPVANTIPST